MKRLIHITALLWFAIGEPPPAGAQGLSDLMVRSLRPTVEEAGAAELLEIALHQDKALGQIDSAAAAYSRIIELHSLRQATRETAERARMRLAWLRQSGLATPDFDPLPGPPDLPGALRRVTSLAHSLQLGGLPSSVEGQTASPPAKSRVQPLDARRRWLARVVLSREWQPPDDGSDEPSALRMIGSGIDAVRRILGLKGLLHYVEQELRRRRPRPLTAHEKLLSALVAEKEYRDFGSAIVRYRDVVQLSPNGGIATRLSERARLGVERCAQWQRNDPAGRNSGYRPQES